MPAVISSQPAAEAEATWGFSEVAIAVHFTGGPGAKVGWLVSESQKLDGLGLCVRSRPIDNDRSDERSI